MKRKKKREKGDVRKAGYIKLEEKDFHVTVAPGEMVINPMDIAKDLLIALTKLAHLPHEARSNTHTLFGDLLYKNIQQGNLKVPLEIWHQMGLEVGMFALTTASVSTQIEVESRAIRFDDHQPGAPLPKPLAVVQGTDKAQ